MERLKYCDICQCEMNTVENDLRQRARHHFYPKKWRETRKDRQQTIDICLSCHRNFHEHLSSFGKAKNKKFFVEKYDEYRTAYILERLKFENFRNEKREVKLPKQGVCYVEV